MSNRKVAVVIGIGPGIGRAVAVRFAKEGFSVGLIARSKDKLQAVEEEIKKLGRSEPVLSVPADATDPKAIQQAFKLIHETLGFTNVLIYNAGAFKYGGILEVTPQQFEDTWKANCFGGFLAAQQVLPHMLEQKAGTILYTGATAALRGSAKFALLAVGKFGLRALAQSIAREHAPNGIHVAHIIVDGQVDFERGQNTSKPADAYLKSDAIADEYWKLYTQDKTTWSLEIDVRPYVEKF